ncbi:MAG: 3-hydroxyacyl-CoA dehydrogenase [Lysobacterales bacterium]
MATFACIGAGNVGSAWALVFAKAGHQVNLFDQSQSSLHSRWLPQIADTLSLLYSEQMLNEEPSQVLDRIQVSTSLATAVADAAYVQESVREDLQIKRAVFSEIAQSTTDQCVLASSTSALPGSQFLKDIHLPQRALVVHPVNPPSLIPLVELCATPWTSPLVLQQTQQLMTTLGMKPITVRKEIDGFILNRLQYTLVAEAMHLVAEGYCSPEDIDRAMTDGLALRWASIGPFEVAHLNASDGFQGFVSQLGPMMKAMGESAQTDYDWGDTEVSAIHQAMAQKTPVDDIAQRQLWRNQQIIRTRKMQEDGNR